MNCKNGKCKCKAGFKGKKCTDRDCIMSPWKWLSKCECGPGKTGLRSRDVVVEPRGNGQKCGIQKENVRCRIKCQCAQYQFGPFCENQHCVVGPWDDPCKYVRHETGCKWGFKEEDTLSAVFREVIHKPRGTGRKCPRLDNGLKNCTRKKCKSRSLWQRLWG